MVRIELTKEQTMAEENEQSVESTVREIRRKTRKKYSAEEKLRIVLEGLRGEETLAELSRREGIHQNMYYKWSKELLEAGKQRLVGDTKRDADSQEVEAMRSQNEQLKAVVAELTLKNRVLTPALAGGAREKSLLGRETKWDE
jgi:transposase